MNESRKILIVYLGSTGGGVLDTFEIAESLSAHGKNRYSVLVSENNPFKERFGSLSLERLYVKKTHRLSTFDFLIRTAVPLRIMEIKRTITKMGPSLIFFTMEHPWLLKLASPKKRISRSPILTYVRHNPLMFESGKSNLRNYLLSSVESKIIRKVDYIFTLSEHVRKMTLEEFRLRPHKVIDLGLGAHTSLCKDWKHRGFMRDGKLRLLFFGRVLPYKGVDVLIDAFTRIRSEGLPVELTIAGEGEIGSDYLTKAHNCGVKVVNRWLEDSEICQFLSETDIIVLPYKKASQSGPAAIASALGIPVIATAVGGLAEQVTPGVNGVLIHPANRDEIFDAVKAFVLSPGLLQRYSEGARRLAEGDLSWREKAIKLDNLFTELINAAA